MNMQHDTYDEALSMLISTCRAHARNAATLFDALLPTGWLGETRVDHRTLQDAHDILATAWRSEAKTLPMELLPVRPSAKQSAVRLQWLRHEAEGWHARPYLPLLPLTILVHQEQGYVAETALAAAIMQRFPDVQWKR